MNAVQDATLDLDKPTFLSGLLRHLSGTLQEVVGSDDAAGFVSLVGQRMGDEINNEYKQALQLQHLSREQIAQVLVDLKARIDGDFYIIEESDEKIVLGNRRCPFGDMVKGRPSLCMMTSNVFGSIAADNLGYAKVSLEETLADGAAGCRVVVYLKDSKESRNAEGREYFDIATA